MLSLAKTVFAMDAVLLCASAAIVAAIDSTEWGILTATMLGLAVPTITAWVVVWAKLVRIETMQAVSIEANTQSRAEASKQDAEITASFRSIHRKLEAHARAIDHIRYKCGISPTQTWLDERTPNTSGSADDSRE